MAYSNEVISFALPKTETRIDAIPMFEVVEVTSMQDHGAKSGDQSKHASKTNDDDSFKNQASEKKSGDSNKVLFRHALQIHTKPDGYNSGRQYVIKARDETECQTLIRELNRLAKIATDKFLAKSHFDKAQASPSGEWEGLNLASDWPVKRWCDW